MNYFQILLVQTGFNTPWWAWPTTGALLQIAGAIFVSWLIYRFNKRLKLQDAMLKLSDTFEEYREAVSLVCVLSPDIAGARFDERCGGFDGFCNIMNRLKRQSKVMSIFGNQKISNVALEFTIATRGLYTRLHEAVVNYQSGSRSGAHSILTDETKMHEIERKWDELIKLSRSCY